MKTTYRKTPDQADRQLAKLSDALYEILMRMTPQTEAELHAQVRVDVSVGLLREAVELLSNPDHE